MINQEVKIIYDVNGDWCQMWVGDELFKEGYREYPGWWRDYLNSYQSKIKIIEEEKCFHTSICECDI